MAGPLDHLIGDCPPQLQPVLVIVAEVDSGPQAGCRQFLGAAAEVRTQPGATALTVIPCRAHSIAVALVRCATAALLAW